jgi:8-amino-7-oxononanoate synthase
MTLFDKCHRYTEAREAQAAGLYPYFIKIQEARETEVRVDGEWKLMAGSNNYLGLTHHPKVLEAARDALSRFGSGCTGSRLLNGNIELIEELEALLADFLRTEAAVVFTTGYQTNLGLVSALAGREDHVFMDRLNHACIVDGARLSYGKVHRYDHAAYGDLERLLKDTPTGTGKLVATDGVFSMDGDIADLPALLEIAHAHGAAVMVDDAHALGVLGARGAGTADHFQVEGEVEMITATFSKSLGSVGGVVAGSEALCHYLRHRARALLFSAAMPPASAAGTLAALEVMEEEPERRERLWKNAIRIREGLTSLGFDVGLSETPIIPVLVGDYSRVLAFWRHLFERDVYVNAVVPPGVPEESSRLRISASAMHTKAQIELLLESFAAVDEELPR